MIRMTLLVAFFASLLMAAQPAAPKAPETFTLKAAGQTALTVTELPNGMHFKGYEGKPVLLNFFGKNCRYCMREIPHLVALKKKYGSKIGIIGIHVQERMSFKERNALQQRLGFNYPIFEYDDNVAFVRHVGSRAGYNGSIPFNIVFNAKGEVVEIIPGYLSAENLEMIFSDLLKQK
jgi:thiol-disulfide isomerase/thioredoxin